jgi:hypothetical protein
VIEQLMILYDNMIEVMEEAVDAKMDSYDFQKEGTSLQAFQEHCEPESSELAELYRKRRYIQPYKLSESSNIGDVMSLDHFIECVKMGGFIDYDGFGYYMKDGMETDVMIKPSDVKHNMVRSDEFSEIQWFNR